MKIDEISILIKEVAKKEIMPRFRNLKIYEVVMKEEGEFVTAADLASEKALTEGLLSLYPNAVITGEEEISKKPERLKELLDADCGFLIDPIDGTNNFIKGNDRFAMMIAVLKRGQVVASFIYLPAQDMLCYALKGKGTFINGEKITLGTAETNLKNMTGAVHINRMPVDIKEVAKENLKHFKENRPAFCAGYDYFCLLTGEKQFSAYYRTLLWDHLPGTLMYAEAGGYVRTLDDFEYTSRDEGLGLLCVANRKMWLEVKKTLFLHLL